MNLHVVMVRHSHIVALVAIVDELIMVWARYAIHLDRRLHSLVEGYFNIHMMKDCLSGGKRHTAHGEIWYPNPAALPARRDGEPG